MQAIILAGGLGTRLQSVIKNQPKVLAEINDKPFLYFLLKSLINKGVDKFIFSVGFLHEQIEEFLLNEFPSLNYKLSIEETALGTGGAIKQALTLINNEDVVVLNGDTFFNINLQQYYAFHQQKNAKCTLALKPMKDFDRYGSVKVDEQYKVENFNEKKYCESGLIYGGVAIFNKEIYLESIKNLSIPFSFEKEFLEKKIDSLYGFVDENYFIDIGIPEDYKKAQEELIKYIK